MRVGKKPVIAAVNGLCFGGGFEMIVNADMVIAAPAAKFGLPEVKRGVVAVAGALPRLVRTVGRPRAMEMALLGRAYGAEEMRNWGVVNMVAEAVVEEAVKWAVELAGNSPDSVTTSKKGVELGWMGQGAVEGSIRLMTDGWPKMNGGENMMEGVKAFVEKRAPRWVDSKL
jgi:enoyl-CoA hydratase/carnithine racemase